jgi:replicative DNA helicase
MKLYSQSLELQLLKAIAYRKEETEEALSETGDKKTKISQYLLSVTTLEHFHFPPCKDAFKRLLLVARKRHKVMIYSELVEDPSIDEEFRLILQENRKKTPKTIDSAKELFGQIDRYLKTRKLYSLSKSIIEALQESKVDVEKLVDNTTIAITNLRNGVDGLQDQIVRLGKGDSNALPIIDSILDKNTDLVIPTGFKAFDSRSGGFPSSGVVMLAATTSGGKSTMRMLIMKYMYLVNNLNVCTVSMEQNSTKEHTRLLSNLTQIEFDKFKQKTLTKKERKKVRKAWKKFDNHGKENNCSHEMLCPKGGITSFDLIMTLKPFKYKVIAVDYISLFEGTNVADQWKVLAEITRQFKVFAENNNCLVLLLAQLDSETEKVRYSQGILENLDICWKWIYKADQRVSHVLNVKQDKNRDADLFPFDLEEHFDTMTISDLAGIEDEENTDSESEEVDEPVKKKKSKNIKNELEIDGTGVE